MDDARALFIADIYMVDVGSFCMKGLLGWLLTLLCVLVVARLLSDVALHFSGSLAVD